MTWPNYCFVTRTKYAITNHDKNAKPKKSNGRIQPVSDRGPAYKLSDSRDSIRVGIVGIALQKLDCSRFTVKAGPLIGTCYLFKKKR